MQRFHWKPYWTAKYSKHINVSVLVPAESRISNVFGLVVSSGVQLRDLLRRTQRYRGSDSKPAVQRLRELGLEPVDELHVLRDCIEGQRVTGVIQVHANSWGPGHAQNVFIHLVVPGRVPRVGTQEAPGSVVVAEEAVRVLAFAADALVSDADRELATPLHLPVITEATQRLSTQDLGQPGHNPGLQSKLT